MAGQVEALSDTDMQDLAMFFSKQQGLYLKY
jgi:cytochrome c553